MMTRRSWVLVLVLVMGTSRAEAQEVRRARPAMVPAEVQPDAVAKFLAGVPLAGTSPLSALQQDPAYTGYVTELAKLSQHYDQNYFSKMRAWSAAELASRIPMNRPLYYFFGGPDAVSALAFFPEAPVYILSGLEPVGHLPQPQTLSPEALTEALSNLRQSMEVILSYGHFITKDMKEDLDRSAFRGVLPLITTFLALSGAEVLATELFGIQRDGTPQPTGPGAVDAAQGTLPGVKLTFRRSPEATPQVLYYVQANTADDVLKANNAILTWADRFGTGTVYLKAASYLLHEDYFSRIRNFLLSRSAAVLQDDSGIPFRFFQEGPWRCWLFGSYTGTLDIFSKYQQADLALAFAVPGEAIPLPFGTGYKWRLGESNLLLAVRTQVRRAEPAP